MAFVPMKLQRIQKSLKLALRFWKEGKAPPFEQIQPICERCEDADRVCAVCLGGCSEDEIAMPCCRSRIHQQCIDEWVQTSLDARCPYCRHDVELPPDVAASIADRRRAEKQAEIDETARVLRLRQECAQQIFDVFSATRPSVPLAPEEVEQWIVGTPLRPVARMLQDFEKWYLEQQRENVAENPGTALSTGTTLNV